jgi:hypothetical protein
MVKKGSSVRVRQRASSERPAGGVFAIPGVDRGDPKSTEGNLEGNPVVVAGTSGGHRAACALLHGWQQRGADCSFFQCRGDAVAGGGLADVSFSGDAKGRHDAAQHAA